MCVTYIGQETIDRWLLYADSWSQLEIYNKIRRQLKFNESYKIYASILYAPSDMLTSRDLWMHKLCECVLFNNNKHIYFKGS